MKLRRPLLAALLCFLLLFGGCGFVSTAPEVTDDPGKDTVSTVPPETADTTGPQAAPWEPAEWSSLSYEDYFSDTRQFQSVSEGAALVNGMNPWWAVDGARYAIENDGSGVYVYSFDGSKAEPVHQIGSADTFSDCVWMASDGKWAYAIQNQRQLLRVDLSSGQAETLLTDMQFHVGWERSISNFYLCDHDVLYFAVRNSDSIAICRLYLPDLTLDTLYDQIPTESMQFNILKPTDTSTISWQMTNPAFTDIFRQVIANPSTDQAKHIAQLKDMYGDDYELDMFSEDFAVIQASIEAEYGIPARLICTFNTENGTLDEAEDYVSDNLIN